MKSKFFFSIMLVTVTLLVAKSPSHSRSEPIRPANLSADWTIEKVSENVFTGDWNASIALDSSGKPHVSYSDPSNAPYYRLTYATRPGSSWTDEPIHDGYYAGLPSSIALDSSNKPHIGYGIEDRVGYAHHMTDEWTVEVVDSGFEQWFQDVSLALDDSNLPHMSYYNWDTDEVWYSYYDGSDWRRSLVDTDASFAAAIAWQNGAHVVYKDDFGLKYARPPFGASSVETVADEGEMGRHALDVSPEGFPCVVYTSNSSVLSERGLYYACGDEGGGNWKKQKFSDQGNAGSLAFSPSGHPHIIYNDGGLRLATSLGGRWVSTPIGILGSYVSNIVFKSGGELCFLSTAPNGDLNYNCGTGLINVDLVADHLEVTQAIQDLNNSTTLVAGKKTFVRFHVHSSENTFPATARLEIIGSAGTETISPSKSWETINVRPDPLRSIREHAFLFELPEKFTKEKVSVKLRAEINPELASWREVPEIDYENNVIRAEISFRVVPPVPLSIYSVVYEIGNQEFHAGNSPGHLVNWLSKAFPLSKLNYWTHSLDYGEGNPKCQEVIVLLRRKRVWDGLFFWRRVPNNTRYFGMVTAAGISGISSMPACHGGIPSFTAAGPVHFSNSQISDVAGISNSRFLANTYGLNDKPTKRISEAWNGDDAFYGYDTSTGRIYHPRVRDIMSGFGIPWIGQETTEDLIAFFQRGQTSALGSDVFESSADRLFVSGYTLPASGQVHLEPLFVLPDMADAIPRTPGDYAIVLRNAQGGQLARYPFTPTSSQDESGQAILFFTELVPYVTGTDRVDIEGPAGLMTMIQSGPAAPTVTLLAPNGGETLTGDTVTVSWAASDVDGDPLSFNLQYSPDNGASWTLVAQNIADLSADVESMNLVAGAQALFRVWVTDGIHTASDQSDAPFALPNRDPSVEIESPEENLIISTDQTLSLEATAYDADIGSLDDDQVQWHSDLDGALGSGSQLSLTGLSPGEHTITVEADDGDGGLASDDVNITVVADLSQLPPVPDGLIAGPSHILFQPADGQTQVRLSVDNQNLPQTISWNAVASQPWVQISDSSGTTPFDDLYASFQDTGLADGLHTATITFTSPEVPGQELVLDVSVVVSEQYVFLPAVMR